MFTVSGLKSSSNSHNWRARNQRDWS